MKHPASGTPGVILVHAASLKVSGARHVAINVIRELGRRADVQAVHALVPAGRGYEGLEGGKVTLHAVPARLQLSIAEPWRRACLVRLARRLAPEGVINLANLPVRGVDRQFVLIHLPHIVHMKPEVWSRLSLAECLQVWIKVRAFRRNIDAAKGFWVQTEAARSDLRQHYGLDSIIVGNAVDATIAGRRLPKPRSDGLFRLLTLSHHFAHKNFEAIGAAARATLDKSLPFRFVVTLDGTANSGAASFLRDNQSAIEAGVIENLGVVATDQIPAVYARSDALFMPTLLESFSTTYAEAMLFETPIITSDRGFAKSVCGDAALYVDPLDPASTMAAITQLAASPALADTLKAAGRRRAMEFPSWPEVVETMVADVRGYSVRFDSSPGAV